MKRKAAVSTEVKAKNAKAKIAKPDCSADEAGAVTTKLTAQQEQAIIALLSCATVKAAAQAAKTSEPTLWRWLQIPAFQTRYRELRHQAVSAAISRIQATSGDAADVLRDIATNTKAPANARVAAARTLLDAALRSVEIEDLQSEIEKLQVEVDLLKTEAKADERALEF